MAPNAFKEEARHLTAAANLRLTVLTEKGINTPNELDGVLAYLTNAKECLTTAWRSENGKAGSEKRHQQKVGGKLHVEGKKPPATSGPAFADNRPVTKNGKRVGRPPRFLKPA